MDFLPLGEFGGAMLLDAVATEALPTPSNRASLLAFPIPTMDFSESLISSRILHIPSFSASGTLQCFGHVPYVPGWLGGP